MPKEEVRYSWPKVKYTQSVLKRSNFRERRPLTSWSRPDSLLDGFPLEDFRMDEQSSGQGSCEPGVMVPRVRPYFLEAFGL